MLYVLDILAPLFTVLQLTLLFYAFFKIRNSRDRFGFIYSWGFLFGAFVWEDLLVFSTFTFLATTSTYVIHDIRFAIIIFSAFWIVRAAGESIYFFLQQFNRPLHHPHNIEWHFVPIKKLFGKISNQKCYVLMQTFFQVLIALFTTILILSLKFWDSIPPWF